MNPQTSTDPSFQYTQSEEFRRYIEKEILAVIQNLYSSSDISPTRIQDIARHAIYCLPKGVLVDELYRSAIKMSDGYSELAPVVIKIMSEYEHTYNGKAVAQVSDLIKQGDYDKAQDMVMKVLMYKGV